MRLRCLTFASLLLFSWGAFGQQANTSRTDTDTAEVALSNDTIQLRYIGNGPSFGADRSRFSGTFFLSEERDVILSTGLTVPANLGIDRLTIRFGPQVYAALLEEENNDVLAVSVGAEVRYLLIRRLGLAVSGQAYYAPDILTFGSADSMTDLVARLEMDVAPRLTVFGGMRWFEFDLTEGGGERTLQEELFAGVGYRF